MANEGKYNIKAVSKMLGILPGTLRAWERRYKMIAPVRNESGHRLYTEEHIKILKWLLTKLNEGFTISQAVSLLENQKFNHRTDLTSEGDFLKQAADDLLEALMQFDEMKAHNIINYCFSLYSVEKVITDILGQIMHKIGDMWESGEITSGHEHFATSILRSRIGMVLHGLPHNTLLPKTLAVCGPGERHELGLLIFTLFLRRKGFDVVYLGASTAEEDVEKLIKIIKPRFLFLSCTLTENLSDTLKLAKQLASDYKDMDIGLGGYAIDMMDSFNKNKFHSMIVGSTEFDWGKWLKDRLG